MSLADYSQMLELQAKASNTISSYTQAASLFLDFIDKPLENISQSDVDEFFLHCKSTYSPASSNLFKAGLRSFFNFKGLDFVLVKDREVKKVYKPAPDKPDVLLAMSSELRRFPGFIGFRNRCMVAVLYYTGVRIEEALCLKVSDIEFSKSKIFVRKSKNGLSRGVPINKELMNCLLSYLKHRQSIAPNSPFLFVSNGRNHCGEKLSYGGFRSIIRDAFSHAGMSGFSPYSLRHSFATRLARSGVGLAEIAKLMGHKRVVSVFDYITPESYLDTEIMELL